MLADDAVYRAALARREAPVEGGGHRWPIVALEARRQGTCWPRRRQLSPDKVDHAGHRRVNRSAILRVRYGLSGDTPATDVVFCDCGRMQASGPGNGPEPHHTVPCRCRRRTRPP